MSIYQEEYCESDFWETISRLLSKFAKLNASSFCKVHLIGERPFPKRRSISLVCFLSLFISSKIRNWVCNRLRFDSHLLYVIADPPFPSMIWRVIVSFMGASCLFFLMRTDDSILSWAVLVCTSKLKYRFIKSIENGLYWCDDRIRSIRWINFIHTVFAVIAKWVYRM